jgi:hypothetical protein
MPVCFVSGEEGPTTEIMVDGKVYLVSEKLADEHPMKIIKQMIIGKIESGKNQQKELITKIEDMAKSMNVSKDELIKMLGGNFKPPQVEDDQPIVKSTSITKSETVDDGFKSVDGNLKSASANVSFEDGAGDYAASSLPAFSSIKGKDNKIITETNKKVKTIDNVHISRSDMGTTAIAVADSNSDNINKVITAVDKRTFDLIRGGASGGGRIGGGGGGSAKECPLCKGSGITQINSKICAKCNGSGFIFL